MKGYFSRLLYMTETEKDFLLQNLFTKQEKCDKIKNRLSAHSSARIEYQIPILRVEGSNPPGRAKKQTSLSIQTQEVFLISRR